MAFERTDAPSYVWLLRLASSFQEAEKWRSQVPCCVGTNPSLFEFGSRLMDSNSIITSFYCRTIYSRNSLLRWSTVGHWYGQGRALGARGKKGEPKKSGSASLQALSMHKKPRSWPFSRDELGFRNHYLLALSTRHLRFAFGIALLPFLSLKKSSHGRS